ncbi:MAG: cytochrome c peroxidase [Gammaproteobacteria bacterium]|jgi:cytochrome c peroxidase
MSKQIKLILVIIIVVMAVTIIGVPRLNNIDTGQITETDVIEIILPEPHVWDENEKARLISLNLNNLPPLPKDSTNNVADDPAAANFGRQLFFDSRLSSNGKVSCATCHKPELKFTDGLPRAQGVGVTPRKSMTIIGTAYSPWLFWDGRKDSQWSQALGPTENPVEHGGNRSMYVHTIQNDASYLRQYESLFGKFPDISDPQQFPVSAGPVENTLAKEAWEKVTPESQHTINNIFVNMGKSIAAYERLIMPGPSRFDVYADAVEAGDTTLMAKEFTESEAQGLRLFIGKAQCINCHNGPLFTNNSFHNTGVSPASDLPPDFGRIEGVYQAKNDPFNCLGLYSDDVEKNCPHLQYARTEGQEIIAAFKTPTLRNIADTSPYMHSGQINSLTEVISHYSEAPLAVRGHSELAQLNLSMEEMQNLESFLRTLSSPLSTPAELLISPWPPAE